MKFTTEKNIVLENPTTKPFLADAFVPEKEEKLPLVIFAHGYKGYKDWGAWNLMAEKFAKNGFYFVKFNFSHNGTSLENPSDFADLESFAQNNYSKELSDLNFVIEYFSKDNRVDAENITLIGHSRGGGISIVSATENSKIKSLITLASVDTLNRFPVGEKLEEWKNQGVNYNYNSRTKQQMPHDIQFLEDYLANEDRFSVENAVKNFKGNFLIIHGSEDEAVPYSAAENLHSLAGNSDLILVKKGNHTFGAKEPWLDFKLPTLLNAVVNDCIKFLKK
ncbi:alpha/beta hydrolase family protein [Cloacibacterium caeni]|uniref:alpha/beta hydrolase family protein n=1 Tax=Cloacibacterium caeni TaxID=2004710 RepID=UPI001BCAEB19|nr:alpha/beta fold hydrolase [Cloacibacterium caeni]